MHQDAEYVRNCTFLETRRRAFFHLLKEWMAISSELDIPWFITDGTLLGAYRYNPFSLKFVFSDSLLQTQGHDSLGSRRRHRNIPERRREAAQASNSAPERHDFRYSPLGRQTILRNPNSPASQSPPGDASGWALPRQFLQHLPQAPNMRRSPHRHRI